MISKELLNEIEHELTCLNGLYASDDSVFTECFLLNHSKTLYNY